jgi:hypothetical protein
MRAISTVVGLRRFCLTYCKHVKDSDCLLALRVSANQEYYSGYAQQHFEVFINRWATLKGKFPRNNCPI